MGADCFAIIIGTVGYALSISSHINEMSALCTQYKSLYVNQ
jgi:hypothetical protein